MAGIPFKETIEAVRNLLINDSDVFTAVGSDKKRIATTIIEKPTYPYIRIGDWTATKFNVFTRPGKDIKARIFVYDNSRSNLAMINLLDLIDKAVDDKTISLTSYDTVYIQYDDAEMIEDDRGSTRQGILIYNILLQEKST